MRYAASTDSNQTEIVKSARKIGFSVYVTSRIGKGFPDVVLGMYGLNFLCEIKDPKKPPSARKLTPDEQEFFSGWRGNVCVIETDADLFALRQRALEWSALIKGVQCPTRHCAPPQYTVMPRRDK